MTTTYLQVLTTTNNPDDARRIARALVEERLAACVQVSGPVESTYHWQGKIETAAEWRLVVKTREDLFDTIQTRITQLHPYDVPEVIAMPITAGSKAYLAWLDTELG